MRTLALLVVWMSFGAPAAAEVVDSTVNGFGVRNVARVANGGVVHLTVV